MNSQVRGIVGCGEFFFDNDARIMNSLNECNVLVEGMVSVNSR